MKEARYFYVPQAIEKNELPAEEAAHALRVLRLKPGDELFLMDGEGVFYEAYVTQTDKHCYYQIEKALPQPKTWSAHIHLGIAPTKMMERIEWLAEKATEIGFDELSFLHCKFSERKTLRADRVEKIIISAAKQSRKSFLPQVHELTPFSQFIDESEEGHRYIAHCYDEIERVDFFNELNQLTDDDPITILVGPEGDFSIDEVKLAMAKGYKSISLGKSRLRTETAGLYAVMLAQLAKRK
jgi:16S rRNA (uracil1498-N3)-methyltransferase